MSQLGRFLQLQREYSDVADFALVYLEEAHPTDGWMYESVTHLVPQHTTVEARCAAAELLAAEVRALLASQPGAVPAPPPLVVDTLANEASLAFGALPERLVVLQGGVVRFVGGKGPEEYSIDEARQALRRLVGR